MVGSLGTQVAPFILLFPESVSDSGSSRAFLDSTLPSIQ